MTKEYEMFRRLLDDCITADYSEIHLVVPFKVLNYAVYGRKLSSKRNGSFRFQTNGLFLKYERVKLFSPFIQLNLKDLIKEV